MGYHFIFYAFKVLCINHRKGSTINNLFRLYDVLMFLRRSYLIRFTVWHQYTNRRYENEGSRIDYSLVDEALAAHMISDYGESSSTSCALRSGGYTAEDTLSEDAALCAATANGGFQPASFNGGGITSASQKTLDSQFGQKHTGYEK